jgi:hypothetical protein
MNIGLALNTMTANHVNQVALKDVEEMTLAIYVLIHSVISAMILSKIVAWSVVLVLLILIIVHVMKVECLTMRYIVALSVDLMNFFMKIRVLNAQICVSAVVT